jgi:glutaredoxin
VKAKDLLNLKGEPFLEINISENIDARDRLKNKGFKTVPQIFYPDGEYYGNYHDLEKKYV